MGSGKFQVKEVSSENKRGRREGCWAARLNMRQHDAHWQFETPRARIRIDLGDQVNTRRVWRVDASHGLIMYH
jgi:hypothetical protein